MADRRCGKVVLLINCLDSPLESSEKCFGTEKGRLKIYAVGQLIYWSSQSTIDFLLDISYAYHISIPHQNA